MTAFRAGWRSFRANPDAVLIPVLVAAFCWVIAEFLVQATISGTLTRSQPCVRQVAGLLDHTRCAASADAHQLGAMVGLFGYLLLGQLFWTVLLHAGLAALGQPVRRRPPAVAGTALVIALALTLGIGLGFVPGLLLGYVGQFTMTAVLLDDLGPAAAFWRSLRLVVGNPLLVLGTTLLALATLAGGLLLGLVGILPATAVVVLTHLHLYREMLPRPS